PTRVWLSAQKRVGFDLLLKAIEELVGKEIAEYTLKIPANAGHYLSQFYQLEALQNQEYDEVGNCIFSVRLPVSNWNRLLKQSQGELENFIIEQSTDTVVC
ncbi:MAG: GTPase HflX, partial [Shewanella sp.]|nr:GTPase HflX [Shewanella sp.]